LVLAVFAFSVFTKQNLPELLPADAEKNVKALKERQPELAKKRRRDRRGADTTASVGRSAETR